MKIGHLTSQIVTGNCPECQTDTILVSFEQTFFRCVNCGADLEQKVNGVIKYVIATEDSKFQKTSILDDGQER